MEVENDIWSSNNKESSIRRFEVKFHRNNSNSLGINGTNIEKKEREKDRSKIGTASNFRSRELWKRSQLKIQKKINRLLRELTGW